MAPTLLFLPGTLCDERLWAAPYQALSTRWACINADYRFEESIAAMAQAALAKATGMVIPIGLSMGGMVALEIWRQAPERVAALALFDTDPGADTPSRLMKRNTQMLAATQGHFRAMVETQLAPSYFSGTLTASPAILRNVVEMACEQGVAAFAAQITALATRPDNWPLLQHINVPTLIACGADDQICPAPSHQKMASLIAGATFVLIDAAGHLPPMQRPAATTRALKTWLSMMRSPRTSPQQ